MILGAVVAPHGDEILVPENEKMQKLHNAMRAAADRFADAEELIIISPHNIRIDTHIGVILTENLAGKWSGKVNIIKKLKSDRRLAYEIYGRARDEALPVVGVNFGALEGPLSSMPLDWGTLIPLYFFPDRLTLLLTPARAIEREHLVRFGEILGDVAEKTKRKIVFIVSADQAHTHSELGPYGFSNAAKEYDNMITAALSAGDLFSLLTIPQKLLDSALPDSFWQLLILYGITKKVPMRSLEVEYGIADYFGMAVAIFDRK